MKTNILKLTAFLLFLGVSFSSCDDDSKGGEIFPRNVPFTEYSLTGTSCRWIDTFSSTHLSVPFYPAIVIIINSNDELENYISCSEGDYPEIDFSKWTLLVVKTSDYNINIDSQVNKIIFQQSSSNEYLLAADITPSDTTNAAPLTFSILVPKISDDSQIEFATIAYVDK